MAEVTINNDICKCDEHKREQERERVIAAALDTICLCGRHCPICHKLVPAKVHVWPPVTEHK